MGRSLILTRTQDGPHWLHRTEHNVSHWNHCDTPFYRVRPECCPCPPAGPQSCRGPRLSQRTHGTAHRRHAGQSGSQTANSDDCAVMLFITRVADISLPSSSQSSHLCTLPHRHRPDIKLSWLTLDSGHWIRNWYLQRKMYQCLAEKRPMMLSSHLYMYMSYHCCIINDLIWNYLQIKLSGSNPTWVDSGSAGYLSLSLNSK